MTGIVLAGGLASRMPNKALLPLKDGEGIVIDRPLKMLVEAGCQDLIVVIGPDSPIPYVLRRDWPGIVYVVQEEANGVPKAAALAAKYAGSQAPIILTFCDNVFHNVKINTTKRHASCMHTLNDSGLDGWNHDTNKWVQRPLSNGDWPFLGWVLGHRLDFLAGCAYTNTVEWLNVIRMQPLIYTESKCWDIGTPAGYLAYLKEST